MTFRFPVEVPKQKRESEKRLNFAVVIVQLFSWRLNKEQAYRGLQRFHRRTNQLSAEIRNYQLGEGSIEWIGLGCRAGKECFKSGIMPYQTTVSLGILSYRVEGLEIFLICLCLSLQSLMQLVLVLRRYRLEPQVLSHWRSLTLASMTELFRGSMSWMCD